MVTTGQLQKKKRSSHVLTVVALLVSGDSWGLQLLLRELMMGGLKLIAIVMFLTFQLLMERAKMSCQTHTCLEHRARHHKSYTTFNGAWMEGGRGRGNSKCNKRKYIVSLCHILIVSAMLQPFSPIH
jgi:hypothetical protein